ncbi:ribose transport system substrate-binding protein [Lysinibacillus composti]|uniref:Ribose ABC transporter substrate-binding protein RbsB n=1 Tax=Lysinibacillus composti TaxID=720633 RepID=A0A3N9UIT4_9BACI|nr:ribose ABC transporter substrate-binding protein RbsB [Lysinibacillus composti]MBM7607611.1 ribose transport system substrate-binding protein [Lysinibacillus composti]RQW75885.1 ribose ABC transporter substrate-binding protein RbsB [Lysinibacillus composti]
MKKLTMLIVATIFTVILSACSMESPFLQNEEGSTGKDTLKIGFSISTLNNPFFVTLSEGAKANATELGSEIVIVDAQDDASKQASDVEDLIQQGVDLILINPVDSAAVGSAVQSANSAGIPVITVDRSADHGEVVSHIASDNVAGGALAGDYLLELAGEGAKVAMLEGVAGSSAARDRGDGFLSAVEGKVDLVSSLTANFDRGEGLTVMENMLQANPEIKAVFAQNDEMALGALEAIKASGKDIIVIGFDATDDALAKIKEGKMAASVAQKPEEIGKAAIETAVNYLNGETVQEFVPVDLELVKQ